MKCPFPMKVRNKTTKEVETVPCGKCLECMINRQQSWKIRVEEEQKDSDYAVFLTLTYEDEHLPITPSGNPTLNLKHVQDYLKRVRKEISKVGVKVRYLFTGEYGDESYRPHMHALLFFNFYHPGIKKTLEDQWPYGFTMVGTVKSGSIFYVLKYTTKQGIYYAEKEDLKNVTKDSNLSIMQFNQRMEQLSEVDRSPRRSGTWKLLEDDPELQSSLRETIEASGGSNHVRNILLESISEDIGSDRSRIDWSRFNAFDKDIKGPFQTYSRNPGLGYFGLQRLREEDNYYVKPGGVKAPLPRYYREKLWTDEHKETYRKTVQKILEMDSEQNSEESVRLRQERHRQFLENNRKRRLTKKPLL